MRITFNSLKIFITLVTSTIGFASLAIGQTVPKFKNTIVIGYLPGQYLEQDKNSYVLGYVQIENRVIKTVAAVTPEQIQILKEKNPGIVIEARSNATSDYDVLYPGLLDLHNHTKQNNLPVWPQAKGQFENRFEWRDWGVYKKSVSGNMNPWIDYGKPVDCAAFRWSEIKAMVLGTTYLQGPSSCVSSFGIHRVEDSGAYISKKASVQAPTDLITPDDMVFVWNTLGPLINAGQTYEQALATTVNQYCKDIGVITAENVNEPNGLLILKDQKLLQEKCLGELPPKFVRYVYWVHPTIAGKKKYFAQANHAALIAHLAEGRRKDLYNMTEYRMVKMLGLDLNHVNFVHGVGLSSEDFADAAKKGIGLIWSPFSNLLLYAETLDVKAAKDAGVRLALGSDWLPTGSRSVLEELKIARDYLDQNGLGAEFTDETLYNMVTENPARMINHYDNSATEAGVGRIAKGSMGTIIAVSKLHPNPFTNLVQMANERFVNLVVIDGQPMYGSTSYLDQVGLSGKYETLPLDYADISNLKDEVINGPTADDADAKGNHLVMLAQKVATKTFAAANKCNFASPKGFVFQSSFKDDPELEIFQTKTGMNMDRIADITKLLAINVLTQSRNRIDKKEGDPKFALDYFPPLYACNDDHHVQKLTQFVGTELPFNIKERTNLRKSQSIGKGTDTLINNYHLK